jgi:hypothetical protein
VRRTIQACAAILIAVILVGCAPRASDDAPKDEEQMTSSEIPALDDITQKYDSTLAELRDVISTTQPAGEWTALDEAELSPGDESIAGPTATHRFSEIWVLSAPVEQSSREALLAELNEPIGRAGFGEFVVFVDGPDAFEAVAEDQYGGEMRFATSEATVVVRYLTGSHPAGE